MTLNTSEDDVILKETESDANKNNFVPPTNIFEKQNFTTLTSNLSQASIMSATSLQVDAGVVNVNNSIVDNMNIVSISKPDNDLPFVEEVHHNRMRRNVDDSLKSVEVINHNSMQWRLENRTCSLWSTGLG